MLNDEEFAEWHTRLDLSQEAVDIIRRIRTSPPNRSVESRVGNVTVRFPSDKMGCVIQGESHTMELAFIYEREYDDDTFEFYDQPQPALYLDYQSKTGRRLCHPHTADFFTLGRTVAMTGWVECKPEEQLGKLTERNPNRYCRGDGGRWICPPGERYAAQWGLAYRVYSSDDINWTLQRNLRFLADYYRKDCPPVSVEVINAVLPVVKATPGITLASLLDYFTEE
jgi:putative transposase